MTDKKETTVAMAYGREGWVEKLSRMIAGALGEYAKHKYATLVGYNAHGWEPEVRRLVKSIEVFIATSKTKSRFDRGEAIAEAISRAFVEQIRVTKARNLISGMSVEYRERVGHTSYAADLLVIEMLKKYLPPDLVVRYPDPVSED